MRTKFFSLLPVLAGIACATLTTSCEKKEEEQPKPVIPTVKTKPAVKQTDNSYHIAGEVSDIGSNHIISHGFYWGTKLNASGSDIGNSTAVTMGKVQEAKSFEYSLKNLDVFTTYYYKAYITYGNSTTKYGSIVSFTTTAPTVSSYSPAIGSDMTTISIKGQGFGSATDKYDVVLYTKKTNTAQPDRQTLQIVSVSDTLLKVRTPILLGTDPAKALYFTESIPAAELKIEDKSKTQSISIGSYQYKYDFYIHPSQRTGKVGDIFRVYTYYSRRTPSPQQLTYKFGEVEIKPESYQERFDLTSTDFIYGHEITFKVPAGATPGKVKLKITSIHNEDFIIRNASSDEFEVK